MSNLNPAPESSVRVASFLRAVGLAVIVVAALLGLNSLGSLSVRWMALGLALHLAPAAMRFARSLRLASVWIALFLVCQALVSLAIGSAGDGRLPANLSRTIDIPDGAVLGISGRQVLTTDKLGFRVTRPVDYDHKSPGTLRILAIGGSTTEQPLLDDRKTWTHLLQETLQAQLPDTIVEVINAGASGTRAEHHLVTLRSAQAVQADVVLLLVGINDWNKHIRESFGSRSFGPLQEVLWNLRLENTLLGGALRRSFEALGRVAGRSTADATSVMAGVTPSIERTDQRALVLPAVAPEYAGTIEQIIAECRRQRTHCVFLTQPHAYSDEAEPELLARFWMTPPFEDYSLDIDSLAGIADLYNDYLMGLADGRAIAVCDTAAAMAASPDAFYDDCHLNEKGARAFSAAVARCLATDPARLPVRPR